MARLKKIIFIPLFIVLFTQKTMGSTAILMHIDQEALFNENVSLVSVQINAVEYATIDGHLCDAVYTATIATSLSKGFESREEIVFSGPKGTVHNESIGLSIGSEYLLLVNDRRKSLDELTKNLALDETIASCLPLMPNVISNYAFPINYDLDENKKIIAFSVALISLPTEIILKRRRIIDVYNGGTNKTLNDDQIVLWDEFEFWFRKVEAANTIEN